MEAFHIGHADYETAYLYAPDDGTAYCVLFLFNGGRINQIIVTDR